MNTNTISLSSLSSNHTQRVGDLIFDDLTTLSLVLSGIYSASIPLYMTISWGDGVVESFDNNIYQMVNNEVLPFNGTLPIFSNVYSHVYYPSSTALYKNLSAQVLIEYSNNEKNWFVIPIKIRTYGHSESIGEMTLINTNIIPDDDNRKEYQFNTGVGDYVVEIRES